MKCLQKISVIRRVQLKKIGLSGLLIFYFLSSVSVADDTCLLPSLEGGNTFVSFISPVIPAANSISGRFAYLALFKPSTDNLWEGDLKKFAMDEDGNLVDANGDPALDPGGRLKTDAQPIWALKNSSIDNSNRKIYTYLGASKDLTDSSNEFDTTNGAITAQVLGNPTKHTVSEIINYVQGADVLDEDGDKDTTENRSFILGDIMHSTPLVLTYHYPDNTSQTYVYFGANDGMLHAVLDTETEANGDLTTYGQEVWAFIPPDQLHRLKNLAEGEEHTYFVDSSPKAYTIDVDGDGILDKDEGDRVILICGERKGGRSYFALDITDPQEPRFLWRISSSNDAAAFKLPPGARPDLVIPQLGQTWSEPVFGKVKTADDDTVGTPVFFIGGGYTPHNCGGRAILAINILDGSVLRCFRVHGMHFSIPSSVAAVDEDGNGFIDKLYVGDVGGQIWRVGKFTDSQGDPLPFPQADENIFSWKAHRLFTAPPNRSFFYPPSVVFEKGYDLLLIGTGNREDPCDPTSSDRIYAIKDLHDDTTLTELDLVDVTNLSSSSNVSLPDLDNEAADVDKNGYIDRGWFIRLAQGEKVLEKGLVFNKVYYVTTFRPIENQGVSTLYAVNYKTGAPALFTSGNNNNRNRVIGLGLSSRPVVYIGKSKFRLLASTATGATIAVGPGSGNLTTPEAAILSIEPLVPRSNLFYLWWMVL